MRALILIFTLWGCPEVDPAGLVKGAPEADSADDTDAGGGDSEAGEDSEAGQDSEASEDSDPDSGREETGPTGFIGSPCTSDADCPYDGGVCLTSSDGYPGGTCSMDCASTCPDETGYPTTSCIDEGELPAGVPGEDGSCLSRCDFGVYPYDGCREGYGCVQVGRADADLLDVYACVPGETSDFGACREALAARGAPFEPQIRDVEHPDEDESLDCIIDEPVQLGPTVAGVDMRYYYDDEADRVLVSCATATAILDSLEDVGPLGVIELEHVGTYSCRTISGSSSLSQHGLANAIDIYGFTFEDGTYWTVYDDWEDGDDTPESAGGQFLYDAVHRWYDDWIWNIILTPEYNEAHDNHFHVDMTEDSHYLGFTDSTPHYLGTPPGGVMD